MTQINTKPGYWYRTASGELTSNQIREGDLIEARMTCGGIKKGKLYKVFTPNSTRQLTIQADPCDGVDYCTCYNDWTLLTRDAPRDIKEYIKTKTNEKVDNNQTSQTMSTMTYDYLDKKTFPEHKRSIEIEVGDTVRQGSVENSGSCCSCQYGIEYVIQKKPGSNALGIGADKDNLCSCTSSWTLIKKHNTFIMNLTQSFKAIFRTEPAKTFVKAGITNENGDLTIEGQTVFLAYLLQVNGDAFKKDIVDEILKEQAAEKKA